MESTFFDALNSKIDGVTSCQELQSVTAEVTAVMQKMLVDAQAEMAALAPLMVVPGANFGAIIGWITSMIESVTVPYNNLITQVALLTAKLSELQSKIAQKTAELGCDL